MFTPLNIAHLTPPKRPLKEGPAPHLQWVEVRLLVIDDEFQRSVTRAGAANIARIAEYFEWSKFSPVIVAPIKGGLFSVIDGQHRATAAMLRGLEEVPCQIIHIDREKQAEAFAAINGNTTRVNPQQVFFARLTGRDPQATALQEILSAAEVTVCRSNVTLRDQKVGQTAAVGVMINCMKKYGRETLISALQCVTQSGNGNAGFLRATMIEALCSVLHKNPLWRDSGEALFRAMDEFDFVVAWDDAIARRQTVPSITTQALLAETVTSHLSKAFSRKKAA